MTEYVKIKYVKMETFGEKIRKLREEKTLPLRTVAAYLDIDQAILSKIERGQRTSSRQLVVKVALYFQADKNELLIAWLSDKLVTEMADEDLAIQAFQAAEEKVLYGSKPKLDIGAMISNINLVLNKDGRVNTAWLFGSFARGEARMNSDLDLMIELNNRKKYSMFDFIDIAYQIENKIKRKVDLVEKGELLDFALETAQNDLIKIYG